MKKERITVAGICVNHFRDRYPLHHRTTPYLAGRRGYTSAGCAPPNTRIKRTEQKERET